MADIAVPMLANLEDEARGGRENGAVKEAVMRESFFIHFFFIILHAATEALRVKPASASIFTLLRFKKMALLAASESVWIFSLT